MPTEQTPRLGVHALSMRTSSGRAVMPTTELDFVPVVSLQIKSSSGLSDADPRGWPLEICSSDKLQDFPGKDLQRRVVLSEQQERVQMPRPPLAGVVSAWSADGEMLEARLRPGSTGKEGSRTQRSPTRGCSGLLPPAAQSGGFITLQVHMAAPRADQPVIPHQLTGPRATQQPALAP